MDAKERAARSAVSQVQNGMILGLGTGSTVRKALQALAARIREEKIEILGVPTSVATEEEATRLGIPLTSLEVHPELDLAFDGADQVDPQLHAIKGYGGALLREKIVARCAKRLLLMVDPSKLCETLRLAVPVEVLPFGMGAAWRRLEALQGKPRLRLRGKAPYVSDNGNHIVDVDFGAIHQPADLAAAIERIPGVMDHGLFVGLADEVHVGEADSSRVMRRQAKA